MPLRIEPIACSRIPKCSVRPYGLACHSLVEASVGPNESAPFIVVRLLSARSAEPPHSSGRTSASALSTSPEALRVARPLGSGSQLGSFGPALGQAVGACPVEQGLALRVGGGPP